MTELLLFVILRCFYIAQVSLKLILRMRMILYSFSFTCMWHVCGICIVTHVWRISEYVLYMCVVHLCTGVYMYGLCLSMCALYACGICLCMYVLHVCCVSEYVCLHVCGHSCEKPRLALKTSDHTDSTSLVGQLVRLIKWLIFTLQINFQHYIQLISTSEILGLQADRPTPHIYMDARNIKSSSYTCMGVSLSSYLSPQTQP